MPVCSTACRDAKARTGRTMVAVSCAGCGAPFQKIASEVDRSSARDGKHYCGMPCYLAHVDHAMLGRIGARAPRHVDPALAQARSRKGGLARAANLTPERRREIAMIGVRAKRAAGKEAERRGALHRRFGKAVALGVRLGRGGR